MTNKKLSAMTDQELLEEAKKQRRVSIINAFFIGFLIGIIVFSLVKNTWGLLTIIPLFIIYRMVNDKAGKRSRELEQLLKERNLTRR